MFEPKKCIAKSPAKIIISGEHSVIYGAPAIGLAVDCYAKSTAQACSLGKISLNLLNLKFAKSYTLSTLKKVKEQLLQDYHDFTSGRGKISDVLKRPFQLMQFTVSNLLEHYNISANQGVKISINSSIPIGCGMGSSAATVVSTLHALGGLFDKKIDINQYFNFGKQAENLQHGLSSGLDVYLTSFGGCVLYENSNTVFRRELNFPLQLVNTGSPTSGTGECVSAAKDKLTSDTLDKFTKVTRKIDDAITANNEMQFCSGIIENQQLLYDIGVVPDKVWQFTQKLKELGLAAKICGAGSIKGDSAGMVLVAGNADISNLIQEFGYTSMLVKPDLNGVTFV